MPSPEFLLSIRELDELLDTEQLKLPAQAILRQQLLTQGRLEQLGTLDLINLKTWLQGGVLVAIDGSRVQYGPFYPHTIILQRAMAVASHTKETLTETSCCTPLLPDTAAEVEELSRQKGKSVADTYPRWLQRRLATLEIKVATQAILLWQPRLLLLDGGLLLFDTLPGWFEFLAAAKEAGTMIVGVIEEIATAELAPRLNLERQSVYDRELLFGLLEPGEVFILDVDKPIKKNYRTVFTRFSTRPAAAACDFLPGESDTDIFNCLQLLYATTGGTGRGAPFLLDLVDRKVRLNRQEGEILLKMGLSPGTYEKLFISQREQRNI